MSFQEIEPEQGELGEHASLLRDAGGQHIVERGDAIGGDEQQVIVIDFDKCRELSRSRRVRDRENQYGAERRNLMLSWSRYANRSESRRVF